VGIRYGHEEQIVSLETLTKEAPPGWKSLLETLVAGLFVLGWNGHVLQVKQKFGTLRFYLPSGSPEPLYELCEKAFQQSTKICKVCGEPSMPERGNFHRSLCRYHSTEWTCPPN